MVVDPIQHESEKAGRILWPMRAGRGASYSAYDIAATCGPARCPALPSWDVQGFRLCLTVPASVAA